MLAQYLKVALRSFARNKLYAIINIFALSVAIACGIVAYVNYDYSRSFDTFHENLSDLYVVRSVGSADRGEQHLGISPRPLGPALLKDVPQVQRMSRIIFGAVPLRYGENVFNEVAYYVEDSFLEMFTFPVVTGSKDALKDPRSIVLTQKTASKYFGTQEPVGRTMSILMGEGDVRDFVVGAVVADIPDASSLQFHILLPNASITNAATIDQDWAQWSHETIVQSADPAASRLLSEAVGRYVDRQVAANKDFPLSRMYVTPMAEVSDHSRDLNNDIFKGGMHPAAVFAPSITAILLLLTACFNFMNTSLAFSALRLKEVGVRKVLGGSRKQLVVQFIGENLLLCFVASCIAIILAEIAVPAYSDLWPEWDYSLAYADNWGLFGFLAALLVGMSVFAGAYPSLYVSRFNASAILKGAQQFRGKNWLMRSILTFQFALSALTVLMSIIFADNADFITKLDMGFDTQQTIVVPLQRTSSFESFRNEVERDPRVVAVEGTRDVIGFGQSMLNVRSEDREMRIAVLNAGHSFLETMNMSIVQGRSFDKTYQADKDEALVVSEKFVRDLALTEPVGKRVLVDSVPYTVIGVVRDFYNRSIWRPMQATAFRVCEPEDFRYAVVRSSLADLGGVNELLQQTWRKVAPNLPYEGFYHNDVISDALLISQNIRLVFTYVAGVAISIAVMGLFALSSLIIVKRTKEIGIRKVLGASVFSVVRLLNHQLLVILSLASVLAAVGGFFVVGLLLDSLFAYHIEPSGWHFVLAAVTILGIGLLTVSSQVYRVATGNPVESLRYE